MNYCDTCDDLDYIGELDRGEIWYCKRHHVMLSSYNKQTDGRFDILVIEKCEACKKEGGKDAKTKRLSDGSNTKAP